MRDPASDLASYLAGLGLGLSLPPADGANLFCAPLPEAEGSVPDPAVGLVNAGGGPPQPYLSGSSRSSWMEPTVQVRVRSRVEDFEGGQTLAGNVLEALHLAPVPDYVQVAVEESQPNYLGPDGAGRHRWTFTVQLGYRHIPA